MSNIPQMNTLRFEQEGHVARLTMHRPEKLNAFSVEMWDEMRALGERLVADPGDIRALVLIGEGRAFSSGIDTSVFAERGDFGSVSTGGASGDRDPWIDTVLRTQDAYNWLEEAPFATIAAVRGYDEVPVGIPIEDVGEKLVLPGLVDTHLHINEPGRTDWEGFETATKAAAAGGITTLIDMPLNSNPVTTTVAALQEKRDAAAGKLWVDVGFHGGVVPGNADEIQPLIDAGVCAFKAFLCHSGLDEFPNATESDLRFVMPTLAGAGIPLFVHAEVVSPLPPTSSIRQLVAAATVVATSEP